MTAETPTVAEAPAMLMAARAMVTSNFCSMRLCNAVSWAWLRVAISHAYDSELKPPAKSSRLFRSLRLKPIGMVLVRAAR